MCVLMFQDYKSPKCFNWHLIIKHIDLSHYINLIISLKIKFSGPRKIEKKVMYSDISHVHLKTRLSSRLLTGLT